MRWIAIAWAPLVALAAGGSAAQDEHSQPSNPADVRLTARIRGGETTFHLGEVIPLELSFTSPTEKKYELDMAGYDRSGRLGEETFAIKPESGWHDPLYLYFHAYQGFIGGGLRGFEILSSKPTLVLLELNEWVRFETPGQYRVTVTSTRLSKVDGQFGHGIAVTSNELSLTIVPATPEWQQETLQHAMATLAEIKPTAAPARGQPNPRREAVKTLRYLGTAAAAREMARRMNDAECGSDCKFGLIGSPARAAGLDEMRRLLADPEFPVDNQFLSTMSVVGLPADAIGDLTTQRQQLEAAFQRDLVSALGTKRGQALAVSANAIVEDAAMSSQELPPDLKRTVTAQLIANFDQLPMPAQMSLLQNRWKTLDHGAMLPLLEKIAQRYREAPTLNETNIWLFNNASAAALAHWYELDPASARPAIMREIVRPAPRFGAAVLGILPDKELTEVEQTLVDHLRQSQNYDGSANLASLIHRYASQAMEPQVISYLDDQLETLGCGFDVSLLAYLLRVDPVAASSPLEKAMAARRTGACDRALLPQLGKLQNDPVLQDVAIRGLDDADPQVVASAAAYLGEFGDAAAETALWSHLTAWCGRWAGHEADLRYIPNQNTDGVHQADAGTSMIQALATGKSWLADEPKLRRLVQLSVGTEQHRTAEGWLNMWLARPHVIQFITDEKPAFQIVQYYPNSVQAAEEKLLQFPSGTEFQWSVLTPDERAGKLYQELSSFAAEHGMKITRKDQ
jgi:hypothetical protein